MALEAQFSLTGSGTLTSDLDLSTPTDQVEIGSDDFAAMTVDFADGNGDNQAQTWWHDQRTIAGTSSANDDLDLRSLASSPFGATITFLTIRAIVIAIVSPNGDDELLVGPQNVTNGWQGPFGGVGATNYCEVYTFQSFLRPVDGWATGASTKVLRINKPTSSAAVIYNIWILGTTS